MAEASQAPEVGGGVALVETDSEAEARSEVSTEHLIVNFNNLELIQMGLQYFILN